MDGMIAHTVNVRGKCEGKRMWNPTRDGPTCPTFFRQRNRGTSCGLDTELAVSQHRRYVAALSTLVDQIVWAPAADDAPDSVFVEDQVVVCDGVALFTRSGCVSRRVEQPGIQHTLSPFVQGTHMSAPATLDGGDVLRVGQQLFVGRSGRTNDAGVSQLRDTFAPKGFGTRFSSLGCTLSVFVRHSTRIQ